jgi:hypothetical protein
VSAIDLWGNSGFAVLLSSASLTNGNQHISGIAMNGSSYVGYGAIATWYRSNVSIYNCTFTNFSHWGVRFYGGEPPSTYMTGNTFYGNTVTDCAGFFRSDGTQGVTGGGASSLGGLGIGGVDGMLIYGNTITQPGIRGYSNEGVPIYGVEGFIKNVKIYNNTLSKTLIVAGAWDFAIEIWNWLGGNEIYNNNITGSIDISGATTKGTSTYSTWVHDNIIGQPALVSKQSVRGVILEGLNSDVIIERNYIHHVCQGIFMNTSTWGSLSILPQTNIYIRYNVFDYIGSNLASSGWGYYCSQENGDDPVTNFNFYNNTIVGSTNAFWGISIPDCSTTSSNVTISNNIVQGFSYAPVRMNDWSSGATTVTTLNIQNNIFYNNGNGNAVSFAAGTTVNSYTSSGNLTTQPPFTSSTDYDLTAMRTGVFITAGLTDIDGVAVANPPTIGAYEYSSGVVFTNAKRINTYRGYTASGLRGRASVPALAEMATGANYVDCVNITTNKVEAALVVSNNSVEDLCKHANVNKWSAFSPYTRSIVGGMLTHNKATNCQLGDFGGYNHNAPIPHYDSTTHADTTWIIPGDTVHFAPTVNIGELKYVGGDIVGGSDCVGIALVIFDGATVAASHIINLATQTNIIYPDATLIGGSASKNYTCKLYLVKNLASFSPTLSDVTCQIAELANYSKAVSVKSASAGSLSSPSGWSISGTPLSFNLNLGTIIFQGLHNPAYTGHLTVSAYVINWLGTVVTDVTTLWSGNYRNNQGITVGNTVIWKVGGVTQALPVGAYGYTAVVYVNPV